MCGRYAAARAADDLAQEFEVDVVTDAATGIGPSWNVAPTDPVRIVLDRMAESAARVGDGDGGGSVIDDGADPARSRELHLARWGLVPSWSKGPNAPGPPLFNARSETAAEKRAFAPSLTKRRCLLPADGYYEWRKNPEGSGLPPKTPFYIGSGQASLAFAGLYAWWRDPVRDEDDPARWVLSATILTRAAHGPLAGIHDRVPIVLSDADAHDWLDPALTDAAGALDLLTREAPELGWFEVSGRVGAVRNNDPGLIEPVEAATGG